MMGLHWSDVLILALYFAAVLYAGVFQGGRRTKTLGDFFVAGGRWGPVVSFIFIFASAVAGNEAVVVARGGYQGGLSGVWYWWSFLFATPVYYLFSTWFRRARVYNLAEFLAMRYGGAVASLYALLAGFICILFIGMLLLAIGKILGGMVAFHSDFDVNVQICIWVISLIVAAYVCAGGMMSALITDLLQGLMCLFILGFIGLPFLWREAGGLVALRSLPPETWSMTSESMTLTTVIALNVAALAGGIAAPWIYNWIAVSRDEKAATQCGWGHLWKRVITLVFALYGILFLLYNTRVLATTHPELSARIAADPELAWGITMKLILPPVALGLLIASFFAAAMSSADTWAATSSAMFVDYLYRRLGSRPRSDAHYLGAARGFAVASVLLSAASTLFVGSIGEYVKLAFNLLCFLGIPIYAAVLWRRANRTGMWLALGLGIASYVAVAAVTMQNRGLDFFGVIRHAFEPAVFVSTGLALVGMIAGSLLGPPEDDRRVKRFHVILNTPVGAEERLVASGIRLPSLVDAGLVPPGDEVLRDGEIERLYAADARDKLLGPDSWCELRREPGLPWYYPGLMRIVLACVALVAAVALLPG
jgi:Na+/proline symporter